MPTKDMDRRASSAQLAFVTRTIDDMSHHGIHRFAAPRHTAPHRTAPCRQELRFSIGAFMYRNRRRTPMSPRTCRNVLFYYYTFLVKKRSLGVLSAFSSYRIYEIENRFKGKIWYPREIFCNIFFLIL